MCGLAGGAAGARRRAQGAHALARAWPCVRACVHVSMCMRTCVCVRTRARRRSCLRSTACTSCSMCMRTAHGRVMHPELAALHAIPLFPWRFPPGDGCAGRLDRRADADGLGHRVCQAARHHGGHGAGAAGCDWVVAGGWVVAPLMSGCTASWGPRRSRCQVRLAIGWFAAQAAVGDGWRACAQTALLLQPPLPNLILRLPSVPSPCLTLSPHQPS